MRDHPHDISCIIIFCLQTSPTTSHTLRPSLSTQLEMDGGSVRAGVVAKRLGTSRRAGRESFVRQGDRIPRRYGFSLYPAWRFEGVQQ